MKKIIVAFATLFVLAAGALFVGQQKMVVHEWGTFTSLQDENGTTLSGINTDDEPVPNFVHHMAYLLVLGPGEVPPAFFQGAPHCHPDVTMRLETPVIYFHPPSDAPPGQKLSVHVEFKGGWLSEFYPSAEADAPGLSNKRMSLGTVFSHLDPDSVSSLDWNDLEIAGNWSWPQTDWHVWTAPRQVRSASVHTTNGESEHFLFYRGVAHIKAPLKIVTHAGNLEFYSQLDGALAGKQPLAIKQFWLVDIHADGKVAFRTIPGVKLDADSSKVLANAGSEFKRGDYRTANLESLRASLHQALVENGLYADEADALLNTWEWSYFKSSGKRVFFIVPPAWTDHYLPLKISVPADLKRVMVGRIELVTQEQRQILAQISKFTPEEVKAAVMASHQSYYGAYSGSVWQHRITPEEMQRVNSGNETLSQAGISSPKMYNLYLRLGRFRNTLVLDEAARHPTPGLTNFIDSFGLWGYQVASTPGHATEAGN